MSTGNLHVVAHFSAKSEAIEKVKDLLSGLLVPTNQEEGCLRYELLQSKDSPTDFTFVEEWTSDAALDAHLQTDHILSVLGEIPQYLDGDVDIRRYSYVG
ncbi:MAG: putative quinol monooxygenase [Planctomycetota bacterium]|nr:putative quinol monooxygenase [Planctomycetota bacterium]